MEPRVAPMTDYREQLQAFAVPAEPIEQLVDAKLAQRDAGAGQGLAGLERLRRRYSGDPIKAAAPMIEALSRSAAYQRFFEADPCGALEYATLKAGGAAPVSTPSASPGPFGRDRVPVHAGDPERETTQAFIRRRLREAHVS